MPHFEIFETCGACSCVCVSCVARITSSVFAHLVGPFYFQDQGVGGDVQESFGGVQPLLASLLSPQAKLGRLGQ